MRYRLMVFDPAFAPRTATGFRSWVETPTWTEHNVADPGQTLVELFAFCSDAALYAEASKPVQRHVLIEQNPAKGMIQLVFESADVRALSAYLHALALQHGVGLFEISVGDGQQASDQNKAIDPPRRPWWKVR